MRLIVGYQATPSGADGIALGATLARSLQASLDICLVLPRERPVPSKAPVEAGYDDILVDQAADWLYNGASIVAVGTNVSGFPSVNVNERINLAELAKSKG